MELDVRLKRQHLVVAMPEALLSVHHQKLAGARPEPHTRDRSAVSGDGRGDLHDAAITLFDCRSGRDVQANLIVPRDIDVFESRALVNQSVAAEHLGTRGKNCASGIYVGAW